jgi:hypothetical protein
VTRKLILSVNMELHEEKFDQAEEIDEKDTSGTGYTHVEDPELEKKIVRHLDRKILPWIFALWLLAFIDRSNVSCSFVKVHIPRIP